MKSLIALLIQGVLVAALLPVTGDCDEWSGVEAATRQELSGMRGGFFTDNGLQLAIGIERAVYVNGALQTTNTVSFSHVSAPSGAATDTAQSDASGILKLIQVGPNNSFQPVRVSSSLLPMGLTVIQNTLDNVVIKNQTVVNATVTNIGYFRSLGMTNLIQGQLLNALH